MRICSTGRTVRMLDWHSAVADDLEKAVRKNAFWKNYLDCLLAQENAPFSLHLAVFIEPFLKYVLNGQKTIETRFSSMRCAPYERVQNGDVVLLKRSGGPIVGLCQISSVRFYELEENSWQEIRTFAREICAENPAFWEAREDASFATLMHIKQVQAIDSVPFYKRDRRGWVVLRSPSQ